jgi:hypothetical protein
MPQRNTENDPHRHTVLQKIYEIFFGPEENFTPRMERRRIEEQTSMDAVNHEREITQETQRKVKELTGRDIEIIPQTEADNFAKSMLSVKKDVGPAKVGSKDAESIIKSVKRHK